MNKPYTYLIGWPELNLFYYGVRYAKGCDPSDLWVKYFTSSEKVKETLKIHGDPSLVEIRKVFEDEKTARAWETRVLTRIDAQHHPKFLNRTNVQGFPPEKTAQHIENVASKLRGQKRTPEQRAKMGPKGQTWKLSEETKARQSLAKKGVKKPEGFGKAVSLRMTGRAQSEEERMKRKISLSGKPKSPEHIRAVVEAKRLKYLERQSNVGTIM